MQCCSSSCTEQFGQKRETWDCAASGPGIRFPRAAISGTGGVAFLIVRSLNAMNQGYPQPNIVVETYAANQHSCAARQGWRCSADVSHNLPQSAFSRRAINVHRPASRTGVSRFRQRSYDEFCTGTLSDEEQTSQVNGSIVAASDESNAKVLGHSPNRQLRLAKKRTRAGNTDTASPVQQRLLSTNERSPHTPLGQESAEEAF